MLAMDMVYALNALDPQAMRTLGGLDPERTIYIDSFSKKFGLPGFRLGFAICTNAELIEALRMIKAAESVSTSNVKLLLAAHLLQHHMALAETTATTIRQRYTTFRAALGGIAEYGVEIPPPTSNANTFTCPCSSIACSNALVCRPMSLARCATSATSWKSFQARACIPRRVCRKAR